MLTLPILSQELHSQICFLADLSEIYFRVIKAVDLRHWRTLDAIKMQRQATLNC